MQVLRSPGKVAWLLGSLAALTISAGATGGCSSDDSSSSSSSSSSGATPTSDAGTTGTTPAATCAAPNTKCGDACVDTSKSFDHCGACGTACTAGQVCSAGKCALACAGGATKCAEACVDTKVDPANCGACGTKCGAGLVCSAGQCGLACAAGLTKCEGGDAGLTQPLCVNTKNDNTNCGACGNTCTGQQRCVEGTCALGCSTSSQCPTTAGKCDAAGKCVVPADCSEIKQFNPMAASGVYTIDPDGAAGAGAPFQAYCDMVTDGGGWTVVYAHSGADNVPGMVSDVETTGNPTAFAAYNLNRAKKMALSALETESIFVRGDGRWLKADKPMFDNTLNTVNKDAALAVKLNAMNGTTENGYMGWSNFNITGGGDFGISRNPDGVGSCGGAATVSGFDHHSADYRKLNCNCDRQYLYSYSSNTKDSDASYNVNTALGAWTATAGCASVEGGGQKIYAAMRRPLTSYASCKAIKTAMPDATSGWYLIDVDGNGAKPPVGAYCDMASDGGGYTLVPVTGGIATINRNQANSCDALGLKMAIPRTLAHATVMWNTFGLTYMQTVPGVYGTKGGTSYTACAMNSTSNSACSTDWKALDNGAWFIRSAAYGEPNGDYNVDHWLGNFNFDANNGFIFNDGGGNYSTGTSYLCSDNAK